MMKQRFLILLAVGAISLGATLAVAQDNPPPSSDNPSAQGNGGWEHHGPMDPERRTQQLTRQLKLSSDQQTKVLGILQTERTQMESLRQSGSTTQQDRHSKMMEIRTTSNSQIRELLDSTQQKKWDEMQAKRAQWMENRKDGGPGQQAPPPQ